MTLHSAIVLLQKTYQLGLIPYPRVLNTFINKPFFQLFPQKEFSKDKGTSGPYSMLNFKNKKLTFNYKNRLLVLASLKLVTPSEIKKTDENINIFLNEHLEYKGNEKKDDISLKYEKLMALLKMNFSSIKEILKLEQSFYEKNYKLRKLKHLFFKNENYILTSNKDSEYDFSNLIKDKSDKKLHELLVEFKQRKNENEIDVDLGINNG